MKRFSYYYLYFIAKKGRKKYSKLMFNFTARNLSCSSRYLFTRGSSQMLHSRDKNFFVTSNSCNQNSKSLSDYKKNTTDSVKVDRYYKTD